MRTWRDPHGTATERSSAALWADGFGRVGTRSLQILALLAVVAVLVYVVTQLTLVVIHGRLPAR